ncbi:MAG: hypothetical protein IJX88_05270 [Clostridia bacterium]|nr:hypothetical protein [Clostridia bacterium]
MGIFKPKKEPSFDIAAKAKEINVQGFLAATDEEGYIALLRADRIAEVREKNDGGTMIYSDNEGRGVTALWVRESVQEVARRIDEAKGGAK